MYRLGLQLTLKGGREAFTRLLLTVIAVAVGTTILLGVFADFNAYRTTSNRPSWEATTGTPVSQSIATAANADLWNYSENIYKGQFIEQLSIAALGPNAPTPPGVSKVPGPGQFYASPALTRLLQTVPKDELGDRFPGTQIGTIGESGLSFPTELAVYVGYSPAQLEGQSNTVVVTSIASAPQLEGTTNIYKDAFWIGAVAILFPLLILVNTATRLAAARREERYAAMRLIGATPQQINIVASVDAIVGSLLGALLGIALFLMLRSAIAGISFSGVKFFENYVTPTAWGYIGMVVGVPIIAAVASLVSLRRVQISPLGVARKTRQSKPGIWRLTPLVIGVPLFIATASAISNKSSNPLPLLMIGLLLIMSGLVLSGSWLTMQATRLLAKSAKNASSLLASRQLSDNPKLAFRSVSGLVVAVFVGAIISVVIPAINAAQSPAGSSLTNVLRVPYGLSASEGATVIHKLQSYSGTDVVPLYTNPAFTSFQEQLNAMGGPIGPGQRGGGGPVGLGNVTPPDDSIVTCASIAQISALGSCPSGAKTVEIDTSQLLQGDNPLSIYRSLPVVTRNSQVATVDLHDLPLTGLLVKTNTENTLEQIRTYLTVYSATPQNEQNQGGMGKIGGGSDLSAWQMGEFEPETVGEVAEIRSNDDSNVGRVVLAMIILTLITAGCSLTVTVGGSLVERKRPFTLLRVSGTSLATLYKVVLMEAALPLIVVSIVASGIGLGVAIPVVKSLAKSVSPKNSNLPVHPSLGYFVAVGIGLIVSLGLVTVTLPLLGRMTKPEEARFE